MPVDPYYISELITEDPNIPADLSSRSTPTVQIRHVLYRLEAHHGYPAQFVRNMGEGIYLYSLGGIYYKIRGDGTIL